MHTNDLSTAASFGDLFLAVRHIVNYRMLWKFVVAFFRGQGKMVLGITEAKAMFSHDASAPFLSSCFLGVNGDST